MTTSFALALTPSFHLVPAAPDAAASALEPALERRLRTAFEAGGGPGLLHLGAAEVSTPLPAALSFWRDFAKSFVAAACARPELEEVRERLALPPPADLSRVVEAAPSMDGGEYLSTVALEAMWQQLLLAFRAALAGTKAPVQAWLTAQHAGWSVVGRVHLHLAENKRDEARPFAFLATFTTSLSAQGKPKHLPLGEAVRTSSAAGDDQKLLALLSPVQRAAQRSPLMAELVASQQLFQPLAWTPREAHRFLKDVPALEECGVVVRVPDWWKARRPPRPQVSVTIGGAAPSQLGLDALLDFNVDVSLDGTALTEAELGALRAAQDGLLLLRGKWVEVDRQRLEQVLAHWKAVQAQAKRGVSFIEGMRLLAGVELAAPDGLIAADAAREWTGVTAGPWLAGTLEELRHLADSGAPIAGLRAELRPYQRAGVQWLATLCRLGLGACLADDMGLGKTVQVLALLLLEKQRRPARPHLLVVPASLLANWKAEVERFAPDLKLFIAHPSAMASRQLAALPESRLEGVDAVMTTYGTLQRLEWMMERRWSLVVLDEAQAIKNPGIKQTRAVKALRASGRVALTGTPVENHVSDLWSLFDFLNPGLLGTAAELNRFLKRSGSWGPLRELTRPYLLRRLKTDKAVISDLPEKTEVRAYCTLTAKQQALYGDAVEALRRELGEVDGMKRRGLVLAYLMRFKQLCNHPSQWLQDGAWAPADSGKHARLVELCETIASRQEKVLVFTQFRELAGPLAGWLAGIFGRPGAVLTGDTPLKERQRLVQQFQEDERLPFFVLSVKAGGTGLNLTAASHVIHFDRWWNPAVENQATDRAFRIGQKKNVLVHKFICRGTVEERIDALIESKQSLARELFDSGGELKLTELGDAELLELVSLDLRSASGAP